MFSESLFKLIVYVALGWTALAFVALLGLFVWDWLKKKIW